MNQPKNKTQVKDNALAKHKNTIIAGLVALVVCAGTFVYFGGQGKISKSSTIQSIPKPITPPQFNVPEPIEATPPPARTYPKAKSPVKSKGKTVKSTTQKPSVKVNKKAVTLEEKVKILENEYNLTKPRSKGETKRYIKNVYSLLRKIYKISPAEALKWAEEGLMFSNDGAFHAYKALCLFHTGQYRKAQITGDLGLSQRSAFLSSSKELSRAVVAVSEAKLASNLSPNTNPESLASFEKLIGGFGK